jgi:hypothetical protein
VGLRLFGLLGVRSHFCRYCDRSLIFENAIAVCLFGIAIAFFVESAIAFFVESAIAGLVEGAIAVFGTVIVFCGLRSQFLLRLRSLVNEVRVRSRFLWLVRSLFDWECNRFFVDWECNHPNAIIGNH